MAEKSDKAKSKELAKKGPKGKAGAAPQAETTGAPLTSNEGSIDTKAVESAKSGKRGPKPKAENINKDAISKITTPNKADKEKAAKPGRKPKELKKAESPAPLGTEASVNEAKRKGRPAGSKNTASKALAAAAPVEAAVEPKRKGRPAGIKNAGSKAVEAAAPMEAAVEPKRRGRPAGIKIAASKAVEAAAPVEAAVEPKRKGRPAGSKNAASKAIEAVAPVEAAIEPKRRGRPAGIKNTASKAVAAVAPVVAAAEPKRKGRPAGIKNTAPVEAAAIEPKRRGRPAAIRNVESKELAAPIEAKAKGRPATPKVEAGADTKIKKSAAERAAELAAARKLAAEKAKADHEARRQEWAARRAEEAAKASERTAKAKEAIEQREAELRKARAATAQAAAERAAAFKAQRSAQLDEREKAKVAAREAARLKAETIRLERREKAASKTANRLKGGVAVPKEAAKPVKAPLKPVPNPAASSAKKSEPASIGLSILLPASVKGELSKVLKSAAKSTVDQTLGYLRLPDSADVRRKTQLDLQRKKISKAFEDAIMAVAGNLLSDTPSGDGNGPELSLNPATSRAMLSYPAITLGSALGRALAAPMRDLGTHLSGEEGALKYFPAFSSPLMLQFFADLGTGQQLDGSLTFTANADKPGESNLTYVVALGSASKKSKEANLRLVFSHEIVLKSGKGSLVASFPITIPEDAGKN